MEPPLFDVQGQLLVYTWGGVDFTLIHRVSMWPIYYMFLYLLYMYIVMLYVVVGIGNPRTWSEASY